MRSTVRRVFSTIFLTAGGYTSFVEYCRINRRTHGINTEFPIGSADNMVMDGLQTGDIVLYSRRWYHHHIPLACLIKLYQLIYDCEFDKCGIIVDGQYGIPNVLELSNNGISVNPFPSTILNSLAHQIVIIPVEPRDGIGINDKKALSRWSKDLHLKSNVPIGGLRRFNGECSYNEQFCMFYGLLSWFIKTYVNIGIHHSFLGPNCPSTSLVHKACAVANIPFSQRDRNGNLVIVDPNSITCADIINRTMNPHSLSLGPTLFIRTK